MNDTSLPTLTFNFDPISNIRLTRMPGDPLPRDKLYELAGVAFRVSERFVCKPRLNAESPWQLYDGVTIPRTEDLILVGNPNMRSSKLVYMLADQAEYHMRDFSEIPFVTIATTRNIISAPLRMRFGQQNNTFQFTFGAQGSAVVASPQSQIQAQTSSAPSFTIASSQPQLQPEMSSPVAACIAAITSYFGFTSKKGSTAQKRSRETAFGGDRDMEETRRHRRRSLPNPYGRFLHRTFLTT